ncbi:MAG TPA: PEP/pyruvate-binding domain-containing protein [Bacteroidales bacterium]|nr:PEP/pyruvate-binding domain-containing protein [Bacteroidales bacterium]
MEERIPGNIDYGKLLHEQKERLKELACINRTTSVLKEGKPIDESLHQIVLFLPAAWQYPEYTVARIKFMGKEFISADFRETEWQMLQDFVTIDGDEGSIEVFYTDKFRDEYEGPFLKEERDLIQNISNIITGYINSYKARDIIRSRKDEAHGEDESGRKLLQKFIDRHNMERDVFHDLMPFRVKEILLIANLYDAYSIEGEGRFSDFMLGEYYRMNIAAVPRLTGVSGEEEAFAKLRSKHFDLIIIMVGVEKESQIELCKKIKDKYPYIPAFLLLNNAFDVPYVKKQKKLGVRFDNVFVWMGESNVFFTMINLLEDKVNADNDTRKGLIRIILLVEDSARYSSYYLPLLYRLVMEQTKSLIEDVSSDELFKALKLKARPKILLASDYESAIDIFRKYKDNLLCIISDMRFPKEGKKYDWAGYELIRQIKTELPNLPAVLQSSDPENSKAAFELKASFINKNSESLLQDLKSFINYYLGFGNFIYRDKKGGQIAIAKSMKEFEEILQTVPEDSLQYHAMRNHFSLWLMARGEVKMAKMISPMTISDFKSLKDMRDFLVALIRQRRKELNKGKVINFEETAVIDDTNIVSLTAGSLGGKGRGVAFINTLLYSFELGRLLPGIKIKSPVTLIIGTDEFDLFMERNHLWPKIQEGLEFNKLQKAFINGNLSYTLEKKLKIIIKQFDKPVAVRSSSLFEDSATQPFSGVFGTYLLPNNHPDPDVRLKQLTQAIKLVFCSIFSPESRKFFDAISFKAELEKMAIVIQTVVGNQFENVFYPHISGTAQSFNFYPVSHMKPEDGVAILAIGLGQYVVEGENAFRFSPSYPSIDVISQQDMYKYSQVKFYAVDLSRNQPDLMMGENAGLAMLEISDAERHGTLKHCVSVLNPDNDTITPGLDKPGPRVVNFADILKYDYIPLASTIKLILEVVEESIGTPVEIEFAVDLNKDDAGDTSFYLLQIKPLVGSGAGYSIDTSKIVRDDLILLTRKSMGNGIIENITDIIFAEPEKFSSRHSNDMAREINRMNESMIHENRQYILIGPGRWGTRDHLLGIPVAWSQITNAKIIVEVNLPGSYLDASLGSHFFHNVTSMNVGYFSINQGIDSGFIEWDKLKSSQAIEKGKYFTRVSFEKPVIVKMDGRQGMAYISVNN